MNKIEDLYQAFSKYQNPKSFPTCECCFSKDEIKLIMGKKLKEISSQEMSGYASSVFLTVGSKNDFLYFFPRIFDFTVNEKLSWPDPEIVFRAIKNAEWESWPKTERQLVLDISRTKYCNLLLSKADGSDIEQWLCAISHIESDLSDYFEMLELDENSEAFNEFIDWNLSFFNNGLLSNGFWESSPNGEQQVKKWLSTNVVKQSLNKKYGMQF